MDTQRLILFVIFSFSALFLWEAWQRDHKPPVPVISSAPGTAPSSAIDAPRPSGTQLRDHFVVRRTVKPLLHKRLVVNGR